MVKLYQINTQSADYQFVEELMHSAFPSDERREDAMQRKNVDCNDRMQCLLIKDGDVNVGFFTVWSLSGISYIEHFAIDERLRRRGYGTASLDSLTRLLGNGKQILEVELPSTEESVRRIEFYEKNGFKLSPRPYIQPPYSSDKQPVPMALMTYGTVDAGELDTAVGEMLRFVYGV